MRSKISLKTKAVTTTTSTTDKEYKYPNGIIQLGIRLPDGSVETIRNSSIYLDTLEANNSKEYIHPAIRAFTKAILDIYNENQFDEGDFIELNSYEGIIQKILSKLVIQLGRHQSKQENNLEDIEYNFDY